MYTEMTTRNLEDKGGFRIGGRVIINLKYAVIFAVIFVVIFAVIFAETEHEL